MTNKSVVFFVVLIIFIFFIGFAYFAASCMYDIKVGTVGAEQQFRELLREMDTEAASSKFLSADYLNKLQPIIEKNDYIAAVTIKSDTTTYFAYPTNSRYISTDSITPEIAVSSPSMIVRSTNIPLNDKINTVVTAAIYLLPPHTIFKFARNSFVIILAGTLLAVIILIICSRTANNDKSTADKKEIPSSKDFDEIDIDSAFAPKEEPEQNFEFSAPEEHQFQEKTTPVESAAEPQQPETVQIDPLGLFSPTTGLSWESYIETRLDAELVRAASSEQDISLVYIRVLDLPHNHPAARKIADTLIKAFSFKDLIFEFGEDGYVCILQNSDLTHGLLACEKLYTELTGLLQEFDVDKKVFFGLSSRTLRLIPGIRLIKEAMQAVDKAMEDPTLPIVAFKVDAERYRKFLAEEVSKANV